MLHAPLYPVVTIFFEGDVSSLNSCTWLLMKLCKLQYPVSLCHPTQCMNGY